MKKIHYLSGGLMVVAILCFLLVSCKKEEDSKKIKVEEISVDQSDFTFTQKDENREFTVSCAGEWHFEATGWEGYYGPNMADVKDFNIEPASGKGNTKVKVILKNELTESYDVALKVVTENNQVIVKLKAIAATTD